MYLSLDSSRVAVRNQSQALEKFRLDLFKKRILSLVQLFPMEAREFFTGNTQFEGLGDDPVYSPSITQIRELTRLPPRIWVSIDSQYDEEKKMEQQLTPILLEAGYVSGGELKMNSDQAVVKEQEFILREST
jgi:hypothetical protein